MDYLSIFEKPQIRRYYILKLDEDLLEKFTDNTILNSCGIKTKCQISIINRILNRAVRTGWYMRYFIICITGPDLCAIDKCNKLVERAIPEYQLRQEYKSKSNVTIYTNEWMPDNGNYSTGSMRVGGQRSVYGTLEISSPLGCSKLRPKSSTPWKITRRETKGHYQSGEGISHYLNLSDKPPPDDEALKLLSHKEIAKFNYPNSFDRYATYKAVDNENINIKLQDHCRKYINNLSADKTAPNNTRKEMDPRSSVHYGFGSVEQSVHLVGNIERQEPVSNPLSRRSFSFSRSLHQKPASTIKAYQPNVVLNSNQSCSEAHHFLTSNNNGHNPPPPSPHAPSAASIKITCKLNKFCYYQRLESLRRFYRRIHRQNRGKARKRICKSHQIVSPTINDNDEINEASIESTVTQVTEASICSHFQDNTLNSLKSL